MSSENRDYPLSETPKPRVYVGGIGSDKKYNVGVSLDVPVYKGFSIGIDKYTNKDEYGKNSGTSYNATLKIPLGSRKKQ